MKAIKFTKIDYIKTKQQMLFMPAFLLLIAVIMMVPDSDVGQYKSAVIPFCYMVFMMTIFSSTPFGMCRREESGFLQLLPATTWDRVVGRFLYGVSLMTIAAVMGIGAVVIYRMLGFEVSAWDVPFCLIALAVGILIVTAEYVFFYLFGENKGQNFIGIVRTIPGMCFFFVTASISKEIAKKPEMVLDIMQTVERYLSVISWGSVLVAIAVMIAATVLCAKVTDKRD